MHIQAGIILLLEIIVVCLCSVYLQTYYDVEYR